MTDPVTEHARAVHRRDGPRRRPPRTDASPWSRPTSWSRTSPSTACAASTERLRPPDPCPPTDAPVPPTRPPSTASRPWALHPQVSLRPEAFGALAYHFGTRRLSFLKSPTLLAVVESLADSADRPGRLHRRRGGRRRAGRPTSRPSATLADVRA